MNHLSAWIDSNTRSDNDSWSPAIPAVGLFRYVQPTYRPIANQIAHYPLITPRQVGELLVKIIHPQDHPLSILDVFSRIWCSATRRYHLRNETTHSTCSCPNTASLV